MSSIAVQLSKAVAADLTAQEFSQQLRCVHKIKPRFTDAELDQLRVTSTPGPMTRELEARGRVSDLYSVGVALMKRVKPETEDREAEELLGLADEISMWLTGRRLTGAPDAPWDSVEVLPPDAVHLDEHSVVTIVITVRYRVARERE